MGGFDNLEKYLNLCSFFYKVNATISTKESLTWVVEVEAIVTSWLSAMGGEGGRSSAVGKAAAVALVLDSVGQCTDQ